MKGKTEKPLRTATGSLDAGHVLQLGAWEIAWRDDTVVMMYRGDTVVEIKPVDKTRAAFVARTGGDVLPQRRELPLVRLGPGGRFKRDIYPSDLQSKGSEIVTSAAENI